MDINITKFVRKHLDLLFLEREENLIALFQDLSPANLYKLEQRGQALTKLSVTNIAVKGSDRYQVDLEREDGLPLEHGLSSGDLIICIRSKEKGHSVKGIVIEVGETSLSINTNESYEDLAEEELFTIVKTDSDFTYKAQTRALSSLEKKEVYSSRFLNLVKLLFNEDEAETQELLTLEDPIPKSCSDIDGNLKFKNANLAEDQKKAVCFTLKRRHFAIIQGPPGTGKTTTLIEIIRQLHAAEKKVLICAPTNVAVDNLTIRLGETEAKPLRLGHPTRIAKDALKYSLDSFLERDDGYSILRDIKRSIKALETSIANTGATYKYREIKDLKKEFRKRLKRLTSDVLQRSSVILCTLNSASAIDGQLQNIPKEHFDVLIVDEASQAMEASMWIAIPNAPKLVLAGDINQLPPVVMCQKAVEDGLNISLMERAIKKLGKYCYISLTKQYRMNEKIMVWSSTKFYDNTLIADKLVKDHLLKDLPFVQNDNTLTSEAVVYIDTCGCECEEYNTGVEKASKGNLGEAVIVDKVVSSLIKSGLPHSSIGVITPYSLQVDFIGRSFRSRSIKVEVSTVDGFQGREKEVIILSLVRSNEDRELGFVTDFRRLNVAVTRARRLLIVIADSETMEKDELIESLLKHIGDNGLLQTAEEYLTESIDKEIEKIEKSAQDGKKLKIKNNFPASKASKREIKSDKNNLSSAIEKIKIDDTLQGNKEVPKLGKKTEDLSSCDNRKTYNVFETIAAADGVNQEEDDIEKVSNELSDVKIIEETSVASSISKTSKSRKKKSKAKKCNDSEIGNEVTESKETDNEFEKLVAQFTVNQDICAYDGCKISTKLIKLDCQFCKKRYCIKHAMQEIHGCEKEIRQKCRKDFRHPKPDPCTSHDKNRFAKKLKEMEDSRKAKKKLTKNKG
ncbi:DNA-binding protein SMUBP-2-like [Trichogramma pretiosum]|uniref:DNA-binding protein SMUBP-2-like n=1 Tax=Trichogramma pretiosum TaxID=7493 RepID=UPI0006C9E270|nr:DNA-binding protein SMUBP-2-like [Trichogramma pretiosum]